MASSIYISVVVPVYGCAVHLPELIKRVKSTISEIDQNYEIILVNDNSPDNSWDLIGSFTERDSKIKAIRFTKNFGQHYAITAGLDHAKGKWVVVMDCDLQDTPEEILKLYNAAQKGFDVVFGVRDIRYDSLLKRFSSKLFYNVLSFFANTKLDHRIANFSIANDNVITAFRKMKEKNRAYPLFIKWLGFDTEYVNVKHSIRKNDKSSYNLRKLLKLAFDNIISNSNKPLRMTVAFGFIISFFSILAGIYLITGHFLNKYTVTGWVSIMVSLWFIFGMLLSFMGLLGLYIGKIFNETKGRPLYIVKEMKNI